MPQIIENKDLYKEFVKLSDPDKNRQLYLDIVESEFSDISNQLGRNLPPGYRCLRQETPPRVGPDLPGFNIALVNDVSKTVIYYNSVVVMNISDLNVKPACQSLIWRSRSERHRPVLHDFARDVFFNYILPRYVAIVSDSNQSLGGRFFWEGQVQAAMAKDKHVYYYKMNQAQIEPIVDESDFEAISKHIWGNDRDYANNLVIISEAELPLTKDYNIPAVVIEKTDKIDATKLVDKTVDDRSLDI